MNKFFTIIALCTIASATASSQNLANNSKQSSSIEQTLMNIEQEMVDAILKGDTTTFPSYVTANYVFTDPGGSFHTWEDMKKGPAPKFQSLKLDDMKVQAYENIAIVTYLQTNKGTVGSMDISGKYRWTDVFMKQGTQWKIIASQGTKLAP